MARESAATRLRFALNTIEAENSGGEAWGFAAACRQGNPEVDTIINLVRRLGIEFVLDVAPEDRKPALVTARAQKCGVIAHDDVFLVVASSTSLPGSWQPPHVLKP